MPSLPTRAFKALALALAACAVILGSFPLLGECASHAANDLTTTTEPGAWVGTKTLSVPELETTVPGLSKPTSAVTPSSTEVQLRRHLAPRALIPYILYLIAKEIWEMFFPPGEKEFDLAETQDKDGIWVSIVNATPYRWKMVLEEFHLMYAAFDTFRDFLEPGENVKLYVRPRKEEGYGLIRYKIFGPKELTFFTVEIKYAAEWDKELMYMPETRTHRVFVHYGGALRTIGDGVKNSTLDFTVERRNRLASFFLAGTEDRFYTNIAPINWMNSMIADLGNVTLGEVFLPRSYHSGLYKVTKKFGMGTKINSCTQGPNIFEQLTAGGVRVLDLRLLRLRDTRFCDSHGNMVARKLHGVAGAELRDMVYQINKFNEQYPGELIIVDIDPDFLRHEVQFAKMTDSDVRDLTNELNRLENRAVIESDDDITKMPLSELIGGGRSAVIVRMNGEAYEDQEFPPRQRGWVDAREWPVGKHWSNMLSPRDVLLDQIKRVPERGGGDEGDGPTPMWSTQLVAMEEGQNLINDLPIMDLNSASWILLVTKFWETLTESRYPNWLAIDDVHGHELKGFAIAVNQCFVAKRCGQFLGRIPSAEPRGELDTDRSAVQRSSGQADSYTAAETAAYSIPTSYEPATTTSTETYDDDDDDDDERETVTVTVTAAASDETEA